MTDVKISIHTGAAIPTQDFYNEVGKRYEDAYSHEPGFQKILQQFLSPLPSDAAVLDCGCGTGKPASAMIAETGRRPYGIDFSHTMVDLSKKQVPQGVFECCNMLDYAPSPASFGGIIANLSLFGLSRAELTSMAMRFFQWVQPGGFLLLGVFCAEDLETKPEQYDADQECATGVENIFMAHRVFMTLFTRSGWNNLLEGAGFEIVHTESYVFSPPSTAVCDDDPRYFVIAKRPSVS
ncbi:MAG: hypothetical protein LQ351_006507 [Letrouitia transgressa]|nr:MAG: hypothetical protein LQ351_006507 [Letrouitia transgressa]